MTQYNQLQQGLALIIKNIGNVSGMKLFYGAFKLDSDPAERKNLDDIESLAKGSGFDPFIQTRQQFAYWLIQSDLYLTNSNFKRDIFLKRFLSQRDKAEAELEKVKPDIAMLNNKLTKLQIHLQALEQYGKPINQLSTVKEIEDKISSNIEILEKGKPYQVLKVIRQIFFQSEKYIKVMDRWIGNKTLDYFASTPDVSIMVLTTEIDKTLAFQIVLKRINEERKNKIQIRKCDRKDFHDRYIITDKELWSLGPSLKDAGYKTWGTVTRADDEEKKDKINKKFDDLWGKSKEMELENNPFI